MIEPNREAIAKQRSKKRKNVRITFAYIVSHTGLYIHSYRIHELKPRNKILSSSVQLETGQIKAKHILCPLSVEFWAEVALCHRISTFLQNYAEFDKWAVTTDQCYHWCDETDDTEWHFKSIFRRSQSSHIISSLYFFVNKNDNFTFI